MADKYVATQAGKHFALSIHNSSYHIGEAKFLNVGDSIDKPLGHYILLVVDEPDDQRGNTILFEEIEEHAFEAYSAGHLIDYCRHCVKRKEEH